MIIRKTNPGIALAQVIAWVSWLALPLCGQPAAEASSSEAVEATAESGPTEEVAESPTPEFELVVTRRGAFDVVEARGESVEVRRVFIDLANALGLELKLDEGLLPELQRQRLPLDVRFMTARNFIEHLGGAVGLVGTLEEGAILLRRRAPLGSEELVEEARVLATRAFGRSGIRAMRDRSPRLLYQAGVLHHEGGEWESTARTLKAFYEGHEQDPRAPRARVLVGHALWQLGRAAEARTALAQVEETHPRADEVPLASYLLGRVEAALGRIDDAMPRFSRVIADRPQTELAVRSIFAAAELWYEAGEGAKAVEALAPFDEAYDRLFPDAEARLALYQGLALRLAGSPIKAIARLQHAYLVMEEPEAKVRAANELAEIYLAPGGVLRRATGDEHGAPP